MVKENYKQGYEYEMTRRIMNFTKAKNNPTKKLVSGRKAKIIGVPAQKEEQMHTNISVGEDIQDGSPIFETKKFDNTDEEVCYYNNGKKSKRMRQGPSPIHVDTDNKGNILAWDLSDDELPDLDKPSVEFLSKIHIVKSYDGRIISHSKSP